MLGLFRPIDNAFAVTRQNGIYRQCKLHERQGAVYIQHSSGYLLARSDGTSKPDVQLVELIHEPALHLRRTRLGHIITERHPDYQDAHILERLSS